MAFVVEDGTGLDSATSLIDVVFADDYFTDRGVIDWVDSQLAEKQVALIKASDYILYIWENELRGSRKKEYQSLPFPRIMTGFPEMPIVMKKAVAEYANIARTGDLIRNIRKDASGKFIIEESKQLDGLGDKTVKYSEYLGEDAQNIYPVPDNLMRSLCMNSGNVRMLSRG